jgi:hypothetical protein
MTLLSRGNDYDQVIKTGSRVLYGGIVFSETEL